MAIIQKDTQMQSQLYRGSLAQQSISGGVKVNIFEKYALILTVLACVVCTAKSSVGALAVVAAFALLVVEPEYLLGPVLFFTIFDDYMLLMEGASISRFITLFFIAGAVMLILKKGTIKRETLFFVVLIFLGILLSFHGLKGYASFPISYILNVVLAITMVNFTSGNRGKITKQIYSYCVLSVVYVYILFAINGFDSIVDGMRLSISEEVNTNQLAMGLAIVMAVFASNLVVFGKHKLWNILLMVVACVALFFTGSRTGLISGVVATFLIYIIGTNREGSRKKAILLSMVSIVALVGVYSCLQKGYPQLMERFAVENIEETGGTGRIDVWRTYLEDYFPRYWLAGIGFDTRNMFYAMFFSNGAGHGAHNLVIEILSKTGVIGVVLFGACFIGYFGKVFKTVRRNEYVLFSLAVSLSILINGIGEDVLTTRFLWLGIGLGYLLSNGEEKKQVCTGEENVC